MVKNCDRGLENTARGRRPFGFQQRVLFISCWVEYVCSATGENSVAFELYFPSASIDHSLGYQLKNLQIIRDHWFIYTSAIM